MEETGFPLHIMHRRALGLLTSVQEAHVQASEATSAVSNSSSDLFRVLLLEDSVVEIELLSSSFFEAAALVLVSLV